MTVDRPVLVCDAVMKIYVNQIPAEGLTRHASYDPAALDMEREDIHLDRPFEVDAAIVKADEEIVVTADIRCMLRMVCARCLEEFTTTETADAVFSYKAGPTDVVDITNDVREEIILGYPMIPVCRPDCKGLCSACGRNLNQGSCAHASPTPGGGTSPTA